MHKLLLLAGMLLLLSGCSLQGGEPPEKPEWYTIKSPSGHCYEYHNWKIGYSGFTISGQVDPAYCK